MDYDILIVGAGPVGATLSCALANSSYNIALVDLQALPTELQQTDASRALALNYRSQQILEQYGLWAALQAHATSIQQVHISDRGHFGMTRLTAQKAGVPALGYNIPIPVLQNALNQSLRQQTNLTQFRPAKVTGLSAQTAGWQVELNIDGATKILNCRWLIATDGTYSSVRQLLNLPIQNTDYGQTAIAANVTVNRPQQGIAYERFAGTHTLALLPLAKQQYGLVWTLPTTQATAYLALDDTAFLQELQRNFGYRAGKFIEITARQSHPLQLLYTEEYAQAGLILLGNAAQTIHPIAAQGFNLGLRDVACLVELLQSSSLSPKQLANAYRHARAADKQQVLSFSDKLGRIFKSRLLPIILGRNIGLLAFDLLPSLQQEMTWRGMGF